MPYELTRKNTKTVNDSSSSLNQHRLSKGPDASDSWEDSDNGRENSRALQESFRLENIAKTSIDAETLVGGDDGENDDEDVDDESLEKDNLGRLDRGRGSDTSIQTFMLYTPDEENSVVRKFDSRLVLFVALLYMLSFLDRSSMLHTRC